MARIPPKVASRGLATGSAVQVSGASPIGQALQSFAGDLQGVANDQFAIAERARAQQEDAENFETTQKFQQVKMQAYADRDEIAKGTPASAMGFHDNSLAAFEKRSTEFLATVPERLKPKMQALLDTERMEFSNKTAGLEYEQRSTWYRDGLTKAVGRGQEQVYNDPNALEAAKQEALREVDASGLPEAEKEEWREKVKVGLSTSLASRLMEEDPAALVGSLGIAVPRSSASGLAAAVESVESGGDPNAESSKGASGSMQVMPATGAEIASELGDRSFPVNGSEDEQKAYLKRPGVSKRYGTHYLDKMLTRYGGDQQAALIAYNGGPERADAWLKAGRDDSVIPEESANYYKKVTAGLGALAAGSPAMQSHLKVAEAFLGATEGRDAGTLAAFIKKSAGIDIDPRQTAWCAAYVNAVLGSQGVQGTGKLNARSFLDFGAATDQPEKGDIVVLSRGNPNGWQGHVGFFAGYDANGNVQVLGGNQGKAGAVSMASYDKGKVLGFRRPPSVGNTAEANERLAKLPGGGPTGGMVVTQLDPRFADLPFAERLKMASLAEKQAVTQATAFDAQRKAEYTAYKDAAELRALTGGIASEDEILADPMLDDGDKSTLLRTFRTQQTEASKSEVAYQSYLAGDVNELNPLDSADKTTANGVYQELQKSLQGQPAETVRAATDDLVRTTGVIPDRISDELRYGAMSSDPATVSQALDGAAKMEQLAPRAYEALPGGEAMRKDVASYQHLVNDRGMSGADAARKLLERRSPEYKRNEEVLGPAADKIIKDLDASDVTSAFDPGFLASEPGAGADPSTKNALLTDYREAFKEEFIATGGDEGEAKKRAQKVLSATWGISSVSGDAQMMKYPPEKFYPAIDGGHDYLAEDAKATANEIAGAEVGKVMLRPDAATAADIRAGRSPRYRLFYSREVDGQEVVDAVPGLWAVDQAGIKSKIDEKRNAAMQEAIQLRIDQSDRRDPTDRTQAMDDYLGLYGVPGAPAAEPGPMPMSPAVQIPDAQPMPGSRDAIKARLDQQRQELLNNAAR